MGKCTYCGESAGFLRNSHSECVERSRQAIDSIREQCIDAALGRGDLDALPDRMREALATGGGEVSDSDVRRNLADGWTHGLGAAMEDHVLTGEEKQGLNRYRRQFGITPEELNVQGQFDLFRMAVVLHSMTEDGYVPRFDRRAARAEFGRLPFNLMKSEELIWVFPDAGYIEQVTRREFQGRSLGASVRVTRGVYVRPGTFRGGSVESKSLEQTDSGIVGLTTKHLYFAGYEKRFRVRLDRIVALDMDGTNLEFMRDTARAKPEMFALGQYDAWFAINVIDALLDMDSITLPESDSPTLDDLVGEADDGPGPILIGYDP